MRRLRGESFIAPPVPVRVADVYLDRPLEPLEDLDGYAAVRAVVWLYGMPFAEPVLPVQNGRVEADALADALIARWPRELVRALLRRWLARPTIGDGGFGPTVTWDDLAASGDVARLADVDDAPEPPLPRATVAVCTRDRPEDLARCLAALAALDYPAYEVLVVDNAPATDATEQLVRARPGVRYVREPRPGLDWARNRAIAEARGEILAFTDDDVVADRGWLRAIGRVFAASPGTMAVSGMIAPAELETPAQVAFEAYCGFGHGWARRWLRRPRRAGRPDYWHHGAGWLGTGANMAFRRSVFDALGGFDPALDVGTATEGGGDLEMLFRVVQEGQLLVYAPDALVRHRHRREDAALRRQLRTWGNGFHAYVRRSRRAYPEEGVAFDRLVRWWWEHYVLRTVTIEALRRPSIESALRRYELVGVLRGAGSYDRATRAAAALLARYPDEPTCLPHPSAPASVVPAPDRTARNEVSIDGPLADGFTAPGATDVRVTVTAGGCTVAEAVVVVERDADGAVSAAQLCDAVADALAVRLLAERSDGVRSSLRAWLAGVPTVRAVTNA